MLAYLHSAKVIFYFDFKNQKIVKLKQKKRTLLPAKLKIKVMKKCFLLYETAAS